MSEETFSLHVRLFGRVREEAGADRVTLSLVRGGTVADLLEQLESQLEVELRGSIAVAVNREYALEGTKLAPGDDVAVIPPVAGG